MKKTSSSRLHGLIERVRRWWRREPELPGDPYAYGMAPVRRGPKGKRGAAAVAQPEESGGFRRSERHDFLSSGRDARAETTVVKARLSGV